MTSSFLGLIYCPGCEDPLVSQSPRECYASHFLGQVLVCTYSICSDSQNLVSNTIPWWSFSCPIMLTVVFVLCQFDYHLTPWEFLIPPFGVIFYWSLGDSPLNISLYSVRSRPCGSLDGLDSSSDFQFSQHPFPAFRGRSKSTNNNWYTDTLMFNGFFNSQAKSKSLSIFLLLFISSLYSGRS